LVNSLRAEFKLSGVAVRLYVRVRKNPYLDKVTSKKKDTSIGDSVEELGVPSFAEEVEADMDLDSEEFKEEDYAPLDTKMMFEYDADMSAQASSSEGRAELMREKTVQRTATDDPNAAFSSSPFSVGPARPPPSIPAASA